MPVVEIFADSASYFAVMAHEMAHATGHTSRLARPGFDRVAAFGSETYSFEELVAEFGAAFVCAAEGVERSSLERNSAAYLQGWLRALKADPSALVRAAGHAQKAADMVLGVSNARDS